MTWYTLSLETRVWLEPFQPPLNVRKWARGRRMDSLMNLEPAMLLMIHSLPKYASLTVKLLEFLFHTVDTFDPPRREQLARGVTAAVDVLVAKGVVRSLEPLCSAAALPEALRNRMRAMWPKHCPSHPDAPPVAAPSVEVQPAPVSSLGDAKELAG